VAIDEGENYALHSTHYEVCDADDEKYTLVKVFAD